MRHRLVDVVLDITHHTPMSPPRHLTANDRRIYTPQPLAVGQTVDLDKPAAKHLIAVCRQRAGDSVALFNGDGAIYTGTLVAPASVQGCAVAIERIDHPAVEPALDVALFQAIGKGDRTDWAIQKAVEMGATSITPLITERVNVKLDAARTQKRQQRWQAIAVAACEQSGRVRIPPVHPPMALAQLEPTQGRAMCHLDPQAHASLNALGQPETLGLIVGPEGGLSAEETERLVRLGSVGVKLGPRILRTETAGVACLAAIQALWGDLVDD